MRRFTALAILMALSGAPALAKRNNVCIGDMYSRADASLVRAAGAWSSLRRHQKTFGSCDDGALAEGYSDAVVSLFAHKWDQFHLFVFLADKDPEFRRWAIRHIDPTASSDDLKRVARNATRCSGSTNRKILCQEIGRAARDALN